jgi:hypothetical protein
VLHQEADGISTAPASKTFIYFFCRRYRERRRFFIVKRAESEIVGTPFFQLHKTADDFRDINAAENLLYGLLGDQDLKICSKLKMIAG